MDLTNHGCLFTRHAQIEGNSVSNMSDTVPHKRKRSGSESPEAANLPAKSANGIGSIVVKDKVCNVVASNN
jgi:hypothetical protein